jgi:hypothetical protein
VEVTEAESLAWIYFSKGNYEDEDDGMLDMYLENSSAAGDHRTEIGSVQIAPSHPFILQLFSEWPLVAALTRIGCCRAQRILSLFVACLEILTPLIPTESSAFRLLYGRDYLLPIELVSWAIEKVSTTEDLLTAHRLRSNCRTLAIGCPCTVPLMTLLKCWKK